MDLITQTAPAEPMPPLIVEPDTETTHSVTGTNAAYAIERRPFEPPATVSVSLAAEPVRLVGPQANFFDGLEKLE